MRLPVKEQREWADTIPLRVRMSMPLSTTMFFDRVKGAAGTRKYFWNYWTDVCQLASQVLEE